MGPVACISAKRSPAGFTLVEILIVSALMLVLAAVLAPILIPSPGRALRSTGSEIVTTIRDTRRQALADQSRRRFLVDTASGRFGTEGTGSWRSIPDDMAVSLTTGRSLLTGSDTGGIDFFPDGSSSGGRVSLSLDDRSVRVDVEWLTGRVRMNQNPP